MAKKYPCKVTLKGYVDVYINAENSSDAETIAHKKIKEVLENYMDAGTSFDDLDFKTDSTELTDENQYSENEVEKFYGV